MEPIIFGDIETALVTYVQAQLVARANTATVRSTDYKPTDSEDRPAKFVLIQRIGGARHDLVTDTANLDVQCFALTKTEACALASLVRAIISATPGVTLSGILVHRTEEYAAPAPLPHPTSNSPRYVFAVRVYFRGAAE